MDRIEEARKSYAPFIAARATTYEDFRRVFSNSLYSQNQLAEIMTIAERIDIPEKEIPALVSLLFCKIYNLCGAAAFSEFFLARVNSPRIAKEVRLTLVHDMAYMNLDHTMLEVCMHYMQRCKFYIGDIGIDVRMENAETEHRADALSILHGEIEQRAVALAVLHGGSGKNPRTVNSFTASNLIKLMQCMGFFDDQVNRIAFAVCASNFIAKNDYAPGFISGKHDEDCKPFLTEDLEPYYRYEAEMAIRMGDRRLWAKNKCLTYMLKHLYDKKVAFSSFCSHIGFDTSTARAAAYAYGRKIINVSRVEKELKKEG